MHIAMWSGPRNLSTAMMYSFAARKDFDVLDEPFYGAYLDITGEQHPMRDEIIVSMECDPNTVPDHFSHVRDTYLYSKQMTHHMIDGIPRGWFSAARHAFLIRHPARVVASYSAKRECPTAADLGFAQQAAIFEELTKDGHKPVVVDSFDIRKDPEGTLKGLCLALEIAWDPAMLSWPKGGNASDGIWAAHWYGSVHNSDGFASPEEQIPVLPTELQHLADDALPLYESMARHKI